MNKTVIFDLDGTLYFGSKAAKEAKEAITLLQTHGVNWIYLTNNSTQTRQYITNKLKQFGFPTEGKDVYTSAYATAQYLKSQIIKKVFLIGEDGFKKELSLCNITVTEPELAEAIVIGLDFSFSYQQVKHALDAIEGKKIPLIVSNADRNFPTDDKQLQPGCNMILSAILGSLSSPVTYKLIGKPSSFLLELITKEYNLSHKQMIIVGDKQESDIAMAEQYGSSSLLVGPEGFTVDNAISLLNMI